MLSQRSKRFLESGLYLLAALFYFWLASRVPYTGDDWDWGLDIGMKHLLTADINSRYAGNLLIVLMTRSVLLKTLVLGASYFAIPWLLTQIVCRGMAAEHWKNRIILFAASNCLLLFMDKQIWQQTYGWISGFANYGVSAVLICIWLYQAMPLFDNTVSLQPGSIWKEILGFLLAVTLQLFIENLTLLMVLLSFSACVMDYLREKRIRRRYVMLLAGSLVGAAIMFSSSFYPVLFQTGKALGNVRRMSFDVEEGILGLIKGCVTTFINDVCYLVWEKNTVLCCTVSLLLVWLWICNDEVKNRRAGALFSTINLLFVAYFITFSHLEYGKFFLLRFGVMKLFEVAANIGFFLLVSLQVMLLYRGSKWKICKMLMLWICVPAVIAPLTAVVLDGSRFYLTSNVFMALFALFLLRDSLKEMPARNSDFMMLLGICALLTCSLFYFFLYQEIDGYTRQRRQIIEQVEQTGVQEITLPSYPYPITEYLWMPEPGEEYRVVWFKEFYGISQNVRITFTRD